MRKIYKKVRPETDEILDVVYNKESNAKYEDIEELSKKYPHLDSDEMHMMLGMKTCCPTEKKMREYILSVRNGLIEDFVKVLRGEHDTEK